MSSTPQTPERAQCSVCRAEVSPAQEVCGVCGSQLHDAAAQEIHNLNFLLAELARWEADRIIQPEQAERLRAIYQRRRDKSRAQLIINGQQSETSTPAPEKESTTSASQAPQSLMPHARQQTAQLAPDTPTLHSLPTHSVLTHSSSTPSPPAQRPASPERKPRRPLLETLADPHTIRLLLYTGAAMLVVGVVIWLRDVLYQKLQEPVVQATLLIAGTIIVTISGWLTTLRTRLRLTGRALTLIGSLLVPINFWFLVRSGLIESHGNAWIICALCALIYASTAAVLRENLYVYLASIAVIAASWTLIYRTEREAFGLYALSLMAISIIFLHLFRFRIADFGLRIDKDGKQEAGAGSRKDEERFTLLVSPAACRLPSASSRFNPQSAIRNPQWFRLPLVHVALVGASASALLYMLLRLGSSPSFADGILRLRASDYDPSMAMLLFALGAYVAWFAGHHIYTDRRTLLYTFCALALFCVEFLAADGFSLAVSRRLLILAATASAVSLSSRATRADALALALHHASLIVSVVIAAASSVGLFIVPAYTLTQSAILIFLALAFAISSTTRFSQKILASALAYISAIFASAAFLVALSSLNLQSETLFYTACAGWPFVLYLIARLTGEGRGEKQLSLPFMLIADIEFALLLLFVAVVAFLLNQPPEEKIVAVENLRGATFCILLATIIYGALRSWLERSFVGAMFIPIAICLALLIASHVDVPWFAETTALLLFPTFFVMSRYAIERRVEGLVHPATIAAGAVMALVAGESIAQAAIHLNVGDPLLLAPCVTLVTVALLSFGASLWSQSSARLRYFRAGLIAIVVSFMLASLRAGFSPVNEVEIYTAPVAILLLAVAYLSVRRRWNEGASETSWLLWLGSLLLSAPMLLHALQYRLLMDVPAPSRDLLTLCASLVLILCGVTGRLRAPTLVGAVSLVAELLALALTSVDWMQIPLKVYLMTVGALILLVWGLLEFRREQILLMRQRFNERREYARERFGEWR